LRILYVASDQCVPGSTGGSVHVLEVARGLAARGHEVHAVVSRARGQAERDAMDGVSWHRIAWWPPSRFLRFRAARQVERIARELRPDALMERYYNFGGEGVTTATRLGVPALLEVNSPAVDHPGSLKARLDALTLVRPLRRWRERLVREARGLVAPIPEIVPAFARSKTTIVTWGANVDAFRPDRRSDALRRKLGVPEGALVVLFSGSFRPWHGVHVFEAAARQLREHADLFFLLVGGPDSSQDTRYRGRRLGRVAYERMPEIVASADIGVAPYDTARMPELRLGFFWSPLKVFEYMASGLPVVTIARPPLRDIVGGAGEGAFFEDGDAASLAAAVTALASDPERRARLGRMGRQRVVERYSWARHCEQLEGVLRSLAA
jgi:glycosyltransferase involved in cell wall biosynthesis